MQIWSIRCFFLLRLLPFLEKIKNPGFGQDSNSVLVCFPNFTTDTWLKRDQCFGICGVEPQPPQAETPPSLQVSQAGRVEQSREWRAEPSSALPHHWPSACFPIRLIDGIKYIVTLYSMGKALIILKYAKDCLTCATVKAVEKSWTTTVWWSTTRRQELWAPISGTWWVPLKWAQYVTFHWVWLCAMA